MDAYADALKKKMQELGRPVDIQSPMETTPEQKGILTNYVDTTTDKNLPQNKYDAWEPRNIIGDALNEPEMKISQAGRDQWYKDATSPEATADSAMGAIGSIDNVAGKKVVSMFQPEVMDARIDKFGAKNAREMSDFADGLKTKADQFKDQVNPRRKNFPDLAEAPAPAPQSKFAMNDEGMTPWDAFRNRVSIDDVEGNKRIESALSAAGKSDQPYVNVGHDLSPGVPTLPNENVSAKVIGNPGIQEGFNSKNTEQIPWMDLKYQVAKKHLQSMKEPTVVNTSSDLIGRDDYIGSIPQGSTVNMYMLTPDEQMNRVLFPGNPSRSRQEKAVERLKQAGVKVNAIEPTVDDVMAAIKNKTMVNADKASWMQKKGTPDVDKFVQDQLGLDLMPTKSALDKAEFAAHLKLKPNLKLLPKE